MRHSYICTAALLGLACSQAFGAAPNVDGTRIAGAAADSANWLTTGRTYSEERFSPLTQVNDKTVGKLGLAWSLDFGSTIGLEATPLVADGVMYTSGVWNILHAIDAKTGKSLWSYDPQVPRYWMRYMCCGPANRGPAALARQGFRRNDRRAPDRRRRCHRQARVERADHGHHQALLHHRRAARDQRQGDHRQWRRANIGVRGYVTAYDARPASRCGASTPCPAIPANGFESQTIEMAAKTWTGEWWKLRRRRHRLGLASPMTPSSNLLYIGDGQRRSLVARRCAAPAAATICSSRSIVAVKARHRRVRVALPGMPGENWDYTATQQMIARRPRDRRPAAQGAACRRRRTASSTSSTAPTASSSRRTTSCR